MSIGQLFPRDARKKSGRYDRTGGEPPQSNAVAHGRRAIPESGTGGVLPGSEHVGCVESGGLVGFETRLRAGGTPEAFLVKTQREEVSMSRTVATRAAMVCLAA